MRTLQKFASVHASVNNHFPTERHLQDRNTDRQGRAAALAEWRGLLTARSNAGAGVTETGSHSSDSTAVISLNLGSLPHEARLPAAQRRRDADEETCAETPGR
jgi:hypothetical protein